MIYENKVEYVIYNLECEGRFAMEKEFMQHGKTSVYEHSVSVAYTSIAIVDALGLHVDRQSLIRGALLHDYFLYDWHEPHEEAGLHGFTHAASALRRAKEDFNLTLREENIIASHMFPLNLVVPRCREAWIVCLADKICATQETMYTIKMKLNWRKRLKRA